MTTKRMRSSDRHRDVTLWRAIPITTVARTLVDIAPDLTAAELAPACHEAGIRHRMDPRAVQAVLARLRTSPGATRLRAILDGDTPVTLSVLERRFVRLLDEHSLPVPLMNVRVDGRSVDCRWPAQRLTVELDGYRYHHSRHAWEQDRRRERAARARGDDFRRYTYGDVFDSPGVVVAELRGLLTAE